MKSAFTLLLLLGGIPFIGKQQQTQQKTVNEQLVEFYQTQRFTDALTLLKTNYPEPVTDMKALSSMAYASQMAGLLPDAEKYYQRIYELDSSNYHVLFNLGSLNVRKGNDKKAKGFFLKFLKSDTTNFIVYKDLAEISINEGDAKTITHYLEKANKVQPTDADVASQLSGYYAEAKRFSDAETVLDIALDADQENIYLLQSFVKLKYNEYKFQDVIDYGEKLFALGDNTTFVRNKVGEAYYLTGKYDCALETFMAIPPQMQTEVSYYFIAECYKQLKNQTRAIAYFNLAIQAGLSPNIDSYYSEIGDSYIKMSSDKKALAAYEKALQFDERPMTFYIMADIYDTNLKNKQGALKYYRKFIASKPSAKESKYIAYAKSRIGALSR